MTVQPRKMSEIMSEMLERLLRNPDAVPSSEAAHVALFLANVAWNECVGPGGDRQGSRNVWEMIEADKPDLWNELKSNDIDAMIDELVEYKKAHFPDDRRRIVTCGGTTRRTIRVEWLPPAAPGVDARWETQLYGLVRTGDQEQAIRFLEKTRGMPRKEARRHVASVRPKIHVSPCFLGQMGHEWRPTIAREEESEAVLGGGNDLEKCNTTLPWRPRGDGVIPSAATMRGIAESERGGCVFR